MKPGKVVGRVVSTSKYSNTEGRKMLLLKPLTWEEVNTIFSNGMKDETEDRNKSVIAMDAVGAGASEYVFYVSSKEACQAFDNDPVCHNAIIGIIDGISMEK